MATKTEAVKIAEIQRQMARDKAALDLLKNPVIEFLLGIYVLEVMELRGLGGAKLSLADAKAIEAGLAAIIAAQQLGAENTMKLLEVGGDFASKLLDKTAGAVSGAASLAALL